MSFDYIERIKQIKNEKKITNDELSRLSGIPLGTLSKLLAGLSDSVKLSNMIAICDALGCSLDYVVSGIPENTNNFTLDGNEIRLIEEYELYKYDIQGSVERVLPESPAHIETVKPLTERQSETFHFSLSRQMYSINGVPFVYSLDGESYASIAARYNIFHKEILRYNDLKEDVTLYPGTVVYLQKKKKQAAKGLDKHIVEESGETLDDIARRYAVRLSSLRRMNRFPEGYMPKEGEVIILRK